MSESVNLVLKTTQINSSTLKSDYYSTTSRTSTGVVSNNFSSFTWFNINLRTLLGDMFDKYERFNISLNFASGASTGATATTVDNRLVQVKMSGLPWTSSYDQAQNCNTGKVVMTVIQLPNTASTAWVNNYFTQQFYTFTKQDIINITIDLNCVNTDAYPVIDDVAKLLGHCVFSFNIYGIDEYRKISETGKTDVVQHRIELGKLQNLSQY